MATLVGAGAEVNRRLDGGATAFHFACCGGTPVGTLRRHPRAACRRLAVATDQSEERRDMRCE